MSGPRIERVIGAVNLGSFRVSAMIAGIADSGELIVLGSAHRAAQGLKRGFVTDMTAATYAVRDAIERAEKIAQTNVDTVLIGTAGAGLASQVAHVEIDVAGRRIEQDDIDQLMLAGRDVIRPDGRLVLHAQPTHYTLDGAHGVANPRGLHAERLGVDIHIMLAEGAPVRNLTEAVQNAHLKVEAVVGSPIAAGHACLTAEERDLGVALVEFGGDVTNVSVHAGGMLLGLASIPLGSGDITDAIASAFGIRRFQAERLKCVNGSALASPADHREMIPVHGPGEEPSGPPARHADDAGRIPRAELVSVITAQLGRIMEEINRALKALGFTGQRGQQVVFTGGGAELVGLADFAQSALGKPVRVGRPPALRGLPETHAKPGFATLVGLILHAASEPVDIRQVGPPGTVGGGAGWPGLFGRIYRAVVEYF
ncbi:cell division protein FtsA [Novosphingobium piscinae]|uniref:Cell division protein FtsA n=1 Tax=Novosphingobium piscinae TaxID=1507448 RepID=A0A7X1FXS3_9SPHN|nr:cell division protein FtsA [Novosphingobium piscinae]MBC2668267.1 cell division protein FtsA [Novosphingobium piscinae]